MPIYDYQCECGLRFERSVKFDARDKAQLCPSCDQPAERLMPASVNGVFVHEVTGPGPQNTGISSLDAHIDRVIGQSAAQGWAAHEQRVTDKKEVLRNNPGATGESLSQEPDGSWRVLSGGERGFQDRAQAINKAAMDFLGKKKRPAGRA